VKRVLIISYYWPPAGGGGVQRWLKMTKYLPEFGWKPIIYTPSNGESPVEDHSLVNEVHPDVEVIQSPIWEPYGFYKKFTGKKKHEKVYSGFINDKKESFTQKLSVFIRGNFFIPDARKFWIKPGVKFLSEYVNNNSIDAIISTGPPHTTHLIAKAVALKNNIPWIADFRDPWTNIDFYDQLRLTSWADKKHRRLEQEVLKNASKIVTVSEHWSEDFKKLSNRDIQVIRNGFDHTDFGLSSVKLDDNFSICHLGSMNKDRNPETLWKVLATKTTNQEFAKNLEIKLIGQVDHSILQSIEQFGLTPYLKIIPFMPHSGAITELEKSQVLLLPINDTPNSLGVVPGKIYEYLGARRPVIAVGPIQGDSSSILKDSGAGKMFDYNDNDGVTAYVDELYHKFQSNELSVPSSEIMKYSRKNMAKKYSELLKDLT